MATVSTERALARADEVIRHVRGALERPDTREGRRAREFAEALAPAGGGLAALDRRRVKGLFNGVAKDAAGKNRGKRR